MVLRSQTTLLLSVLVAGLAGCGSAPAPTGHLFDPGAPTPAQKEQLVAAERAYRSGDPEFTARRTALAQDPVTAYWLTRMFVRDLLYTRENQDLGDSSMLAAVARRRDEVAARAKTQIAELGAAAAPCVVHDLLEGRQGIHRELGAELAAAIGDAMLPDLRPLLADPDVGRRSSGVAALAAMAGTPGTLALLQAAATDRDFTVRAAALRGLARGGEAEAALLRKAMAEDADPFVRRVAATAVAAFRDRATAASLIDYLERCELQRDKPGQLAAQDSLRRFAGGTPRSVPDWRRWLENWQPKAGKD